MFVIGRNIHDRPSKIYTDRLRIISWVDLAMSVRPNVIASDKDELIYFWAWSVHVRMYLPYEGPLNYDSFGDKRFIIHRRTKKFGTFAIP